METIAIQRAVDASNIVASLLGALLDQPRILSECAHYADLSTFADQIEAKAVSARVLADELMAASLAMRGEPKIRRVA